MANGFGIGTFIILVDEIKLLESTAAMEVAWTEASIEVERMSEWNQNRRMNRMMSWARE